jgi:hypothetical protein
MAAGIGGGGGLHHRFAYYFDFNALEINRGCIRMAVTKAYRMLFVEV